MPPTRPTFPIKVRIVSTIVSAVNDAATRSDGTVNRRLLSLFDFTAPPNPTPTDGVSTSDHIVDPTRNLKIRLFSPSSSSDSTIPVIVYFHGGGFVFNSAFSRPFDAFCRRISRQIPAYVISVEYRLAPEHRHPAAYDDGVDVLRWLDSTDLMADLSAVFVAGDSAGGNIAHHVARMTSSLTSPLKKLSLIGLVAIQPFFGGEEETESERRLEGVPFGWRERKKWMWRSFLPIGSDLDHEAANVFGSGSGSGSVTGSVTGLNEWKGFPGTMVVIGCLDTMQDRQRRYAEGLKGVGVEVVVVEYANAFHAFQMFADMPEAKQVIAEIAIFVRSLIIDSVKNHVKTTT